MILIDKTWTILIFLFGMWSLTMVFLLLRIEENKTLKEEIKFLKIGQNGSLG